jgi:hypothetical protein
VSSVQKLRALTDALRRPVYWAGPGRGVTYEFTQTANDRTFVRYLPRGVEAGSSKPFLTIGTYVLPKAFETTSRVARRPGEVKLPAGSGAIAFYDAGRPTNAYLAFPGRDVQIEVYDPSAIALRKLVTSGAIRLVVASRTSRRTPGMTSVATSPTGLERLAATLGRRVYWLGAIRGLRLELTRTSEGRIFVRYLPAGVPVGSRGRYLTVATYPVSNGMAVTRAAAHEPNADRLSVRNGGVAFYSRRAPTNIYIAFPGVVEQIEVFDPSARQGRRLVTARGVRPAS